MLAIPTTDQAQRLRALFTGTGFNERGLLAALRTVETPSRILRNLPRLLDQTSEPTPLNVLVRCFVLGLPVPAGQAAELLGEATLRELFLPLGLVEHRDTNIVSQVFLLPFGDFVVASDPFQRLHSAAADHVLSVNPVSRFLREFMLERRSRLTLDLCSGLGVHSLVAAAQSTRVIAADLNPRAAMYAAFNAALNGCTNIECRTGDLLAPVKGLRFDHIVCNPPFVLVPSGRFIALSSDLHLDGFSARVAAEVPAYLEEGGYFQMICECVEIAGQPWHERVAQWFADSGCDVWLLHTYSEPPEWYAQMRLSETPFVSDEADAATYREWMEYYRRHRVVAMHGAIVAMRRRSARNWMRIEKMGDRAAGLFGAAIERGFARFDYLQSHPSDEALLGARIVLARGVYLEEASTAQAAHWECATRTLRQREGFIRTRHLEREVADFLVSLDGGAPLHAAIAAADAFHAVEPAIARRECLKVVRALFEDGFLEAAGATQP